MKRFVGALLMLLAFVPAVSAQTDEVQIKKFQDMGYWVYTHPGGDPVITYEELKCAFPSISETRGLSDRQLADLYNGLYDKKCTAKGLVVISDRVWRRTAQMLSVTNNPELRKQIGHMLQAGNYRIEDFKSGDAKTGSVMAFGSKGDGQMREPFVNLGFTIHALVLDPVQLPDGPRKGEWRSVAYTLGFKTDDGHDVVPCVNPFALFASPPETVVAVIPPPAVVATSEGLIMPVAAAVGESHVEEHHGGRKKLIAGILIGAGAAAAICLLTHGHDHDNGTQAQPVTGTGKTPVILPPRPQTGFVFGF